MGRYPDITDYTTTDGLPSLFKYVTEVSPIFMPLMLASFWIIITMGSFFAQKATTGNGNILASLAVGGIVTSIVASLFSIVPNLVNPITLVTIIVLTIIFVVIFLFSMN